MTKKVLLQFILLLIFSQVDLICYGQTKTSNEEILLLKKLRAAERVESEHLGIAGMPSAIYLTAHYFWSICSEKKLTKYTEDENPIVRCYAFWGLVERKANKKLIMAIVEKHKNDTSKITSMDGCIVKTNQTVYFFMKTKAQLNYMTAKEKLDNYQKQTREIDSILHPNQTTK